MVNKRTQGEKVYTNDVTDIPTFESNAKDHKDCPPEKLYHNDFRGWCTLHDEWWELPPERNFDINTLKELTLNVSQAVWLLNRDFTNDNQWSVSDSGESYQEDVDRKIQIVVTNNGSVRISTWE